MIMDGARGSTAREGGFAARALRRADAAPDARRHIEGEGRDGRARSAGERRVGTGAESFPGTEGLRPTSRQSRDPHRVKRLAAIAAASVAIAFASVAYGVWASATSRAAVENATEGAASTLVAATDIRAGDVLAPAAVEERLVPQAFRASAALGADAVAEDAGDKRAIVDIPAGTQITSSLVTGVEGAGHLAAELAPGMQAVTIAVDSETGIAGQVKVYDAVRVVSAESAASGAALLETVCERARVVAVGEGLSGEGAAYASVTVEVSPSEADAVREAQYAGRVSLILISSGDVLDGGDDRG